MCQFIPDVGNYNILYIELFEQKLAYSLYLLF